MAGRRERVKFFFSCSLVSPGKRHVEGSPLLKMKVRVAFFLGTEAIRYDPTNSSKSCSFASTPNGLLDRYVD